MDGERVGMACAISADERSRRGLRLRRTGNIADQAEGSSVGEAGTGEPARRREMACLQGAVHSSEDASATEPEYSAKSAVDPDAKSQFTAVRSKLPKTMPADWKANVLSNPRQLLLNFMPGAKIEQAVFFPAEPQVIENAGQQKLSSTSVRAQLALDRAKGTKKPATLKGVLVLNGAEAYNVNLPIK
jgi:DsbC/DsbD-like thiol-disulfide interchange protein